MRDRRLEVLQTGPQTLIQDLGRIGNMAIGVSRSGAADRASYELGGRVLGNPPGLAALEVTFGGLVVRSLASVYVCITGASTQVTIDGRPVGRAAPITLPYGAELRLGPPASGLRSYVSVRGGLAIDATLGSCSTDTLSGIGPKPVQPGDVLRVGESPRTEFNIDVAPVCDPPDGPVEVRITPGPRYDWFADPKQLASLGWSVSDKSDRKGVRLSGESLQRTEGYADRELLSEGMIRGAIQVPPNGQPVVFLNDHPVTGGYPVIGVVRTADIDKVAQLAPGQELRFRWERSS